MNDDNVFAKHMKPGTAYGVFDSARIGKPFTTDAILDDTVMFISSALIQGDAELAERQDARDYVHVLAIVIREQVARAKAAECELAGWHALQKEGADRKLVDRFDKFMLDALGTAGARGEPATKCREMFVAVVGVAQKAAADAYSRAAAPGNEEEEVVLADIADSILAAARETFGEDRVNRNPRPHFWLGALCAPWATLDEKGPTPRFVNEGVSARLEKK